MGYKSRSLFGIISSINREIFLPHIQRPFVWDISQMSKLFDSLMRAYPIQTFLFWKTTEQIKARKFMDVIKEEIDLHTLYDDNKSTKGTEKVFVLDGQQRLQTLFCLYSGGIYDRENKTNLEAYFDVTSSTIDVETGQIFNVQFISEKDKPGLPLFRIRDLMTIYQKKSPDDISEDVNEKLDSILKDADEPKKNREKNVRKNISRVRSILTEDVHFWVEELDGVANDYQYRAILEIFVRVNSGGTKLDASDLMFAAMKELSGTIEENLEEIAALLSNGGLSFEIETILKGILLTTNKGAVVDPVKFGGSEGKELVKLIDDNWDLKYRPAFNALKDFIVTDLKIDNPKVIRSYNSLIPIFEYFYQNPTPMPANKSRMKAFYYKSQIFNWFTAQTDGVLDYLHNNFLKDCIGKDFPMKEIAEYFKTRKYRTEFNKDVLLDHALRFFFLHLSYVEFNNKSAFNVALKNNAPHIDHIYPKSKLYKAPFALGNSDINHIGNYRFVGATDNIRKRAENPDTYFSALKAAGVKIERHLMVTEYSDDPSKMLMDLTTYLKFRNERVDKLFGVIAPVINFV